MKPRALITTAAGRTGSVAAIDLVRRGHPVRGMVRRDDHRAQALRDAGVEVVVGDLFDWRDLTIALHDVQLAYHCPPFDAQHLHGATMFALAAEQAGVEVVALMGTTDHVETITGTAPEDFDTIAHRYLSNPAHIAADMRPGSKLAALQLGFRIARTRAIDLDRWERTRDYPLIPNGLLAHDNPDWVVSAHQGQLSLLADRPAAIGTRR